MVLWGPPVGHGLLVENGCSKTQFFPTDEWTTDPSVAAFCWQSVCVHCVLIMSHMAYLKRCVTFPICSELNFKTCSVSCSPRLIVIKIYWQKNTDGTFTQIYSEKKTVGHFISTKAVGSDERVDITHLYKHPEGIIRQIAHTETLT